MAIENLLLPTGTERLSPEDRAQICEWNKSFPESVHRCVHEMISEQTQKHPQATAVSASDGELSYRELDGLSNKLAGILQQHHEFRPGAFIPICAEKSRWTPVAMLAVMKAGGAFMLADPTHPPARLRQMAAKLSATIVLSSASCASIAAQMAPECIILENTDHVQSEAGKPRCSATPDSAMCAIFTSGSTGMPKGAMITHTAFASSAHGLRGPWHMEPHSRVLQFSSYAFDLSIADHLFTLLAGGCVCIPSPTERDLRKMINEQRINCVTLTPSLARILRPAQVPGLKHLHLVGEPMTQTDVDTWAPSATSLTNSYGPAECVIAVSAETDMTTETSPACIGPAITALCWVVDPEDHNLLVPLGTEGELVLEGPGISPGYIGDPDQTAASFIFDAPRWLRRSRGCPLYKTGDLVCLQPDGRMHIRGRKDTMVKIRGQRVELGEVEHHIRRCGSPWVLDVAVEVIASTRTTARLCAFIHVKEDEAHADGSETSLFVPSSGMRLRKLEEALSQQLPPYMVPADMLQVSYLPTTITGKIDRRRLRKEADKLWRAKIPTQATGKAAPADAVEKRLLDLWAEVLDLPPTQLGREDDWLSLGGDSLLAMVLVDRARDQGLVLTVADIFRNTRLCDMAMVVPENRDSTPNTIEAWSMLPADPKGRQAVMSLLEPMLTAGDIEDIYPCLDFQSLFCLTSLSGECNWTAEVEVHLAPGQSDARLAEAWKAVVKTHPMLRTRMVLDEGSNTFWQVVYTEGPPMELIDADAAGPARPYDLWGLNKPLTRMVKQGNRLRLLIHHAAFDVHSLAVILSQMGRAYSGETLPPRPIQRLVQWEQEPLEESDAEFWRRYLKGLSPTVFPAVPSEDYRTQPTARSRIHRAHVQRGKGSFTVDSLLRLGLAVAISCLTGAKDVVFGVASARRTVPVPAITEMVTIVTALQPALIRLDPQQSIQDALQAIQDHALTASDFPKWSLLSTRESPTEKPPPCVVRTLIEVQPSLSLSLPPIFEKHALFEYCMGGFPLLIVCDYCAEWTDVAAHYDPDVLSAASVEQLLQRLVPMAELGQTACDTRLAEVLQAS